MFLYDLIIDIVQQSMYVYLYVIFLYFLFYLKAWHDAQECNLQITMFMRQRHHPIQYSINAIVFIVNKCRQTFVASLIKSNKKYIYCKYWIKCAHRKVAFFCCWMIWFNIHLFSHSSYYITFGLFVQLNHGLFSWKISAYIFTNHPVWMFSTFEGGQGNLKPHRMHMPSLRW